MSWRAVAGAMAAAMIGLLFAAQVLVGGQSISPEELDRRCRHAIPTWPNYDEDIKAQVGARPFAEWEGEPVEAWRTEYGLAVSFRVSGVWATRDTAMPILLRDALGTVLRNGDWYRDGALVVYRFPAEGEFAALTLDSIEVRYPRQTRRLMVRG